MSMIKFNNGAMVHMIDEPGKHGSIRNLAYTTSLGVNVYYVVWATGHLGMVNEEKLSLTTDEEIFSVEEGTGILRNKNGDFVCTECRKVTRSLNFTLCDECYAKHVFKTHPVTAAQLASCFPNCDCYSEKYWFKKPEQQSPCGRCAMIIKYKKLIPSPQIQLSF